MKKGCLTGIIIAAVLIFVIIVGTVMVNGQYNSLVSLQEQINLSNADLDSQLQRRMDLIPNLVATVKGYTSHEESVLTAISDARAKMAGAGTTDERLQANDELQGALSRLLVVVENYPNLKADTQFTALTDELAGTENRIAYARKTYNDSVNKYNQKVRRFPSNIFASMFGFEQMEYYKASEGANNAPAVEF